MNLPNKLTFFRIILIPVFIIILAIPFNWGSVTIAGTTITVARLVATIIFVVASLTDVLDGKIARKNHLITNFGKFADPLADKMLMTTAFFFLVASHTVPAWVAAIIACRELAVTGLRLIIVQSDGEVMAAEMPGKIKTVSQMFAVFFLLMNNIFFNLIHIPMDQILLYICLFFTVYSGADYFIKNRNVFADSFEKKN
ncbi:CDP-diacylglycerol--glycerol-3-phosphate 3-phosphatidyltransferase [Lentilactobacillus kribbianus]|uniref:CDP-diacylglycerol--glycerol-3-phosphate 3-phosphatidyltransferase n=1 Tax=Lentilactobacillus kribbianus TaxID=2729622 RepID=UPI0015539619|nr:CDP-diacylglycerol--glycerol-3-phosphate 3-phosphatidyltransferase [Lentilactobacillus kribbianus]